MFMGDKKLFIVEKFVNIKVYGHYIESILIY